MIYDILVTWYSGWHKPRLTSHSQWHRGIPAANLTEAGKLALAKHPTVWNPQVSACWPQYPQPGKSA